MDLDERIEELEEKVKKLEKEVKAAFWGFIVLCTLTGVISGIVLF